MEIIITESKSNKTQDPSPSEKVIKLRLVYNPSVGFCYNFIMKSPGEGGGGHDSGGGGGY